MVQPVDLEATLGFSEHDLSILILRIMSSSPALSERNGPQYLRELRQYFRNGVAHMPSSRQFSHYINATWAYHDVRTTFVRMLDGPRASVSISGTDTFYRSYLIWAQTREGSSFWNVMSTLQSMLEHAPSALRLEHWDRLKDFMLILHQLSKLARALGSEGGFAGPDGFAAMTPQAAPRRASKAAEARMQNAIQLAGGSPVALLEALRENTRLPLSDEFLWQETHEGLGQWLEAFFDGSWAPLLASYRELLTRLAGDVTVAEPEVLGDPRLARHAEAIADLVSSYHTLAANPALVSREVALGSEEEDRAATEQAQQAASAAVAARMAERRIIDGSSEPGRISSADLDWISFGTVGGGRPDPIPSINTDSIRSAGARITATTSNATNGRRR